MQRFSVDVIGIFYFVVVAFTGSHVIDKTLIIPKFSQIKNKDKNSNLILEILYHRESNDTIRYIVF